MLNAEEVQRNRLCLPGRTPPLQLSGCAPVCMILGTLTRDGIHAPCIQSVESQPLTTREISDVSLEVLTPHIQLSEPMQTVTKGNVTTSFFTPGKLIRISIFNKIYQCFNSGNNFKWKTITNILYGPIKILSKALREIWIKSGELYQYLHCDIVL